MLTILASLLCPAVNDPLPGGETEPLAKTAGADDELVWSWKNGLRMKSADGEMEFKFGGRIFFDSFWRGADDELRAAGLSTEDGTEFGAARLFIEGSIEDYFFKGEYDFAGDPDLKDVYIGRRDVIGSADVKAGHFKEPFSLQNLTSARFTTFIERGLSNALGEGRNSGISAYDSIADDRLTWAVGVFRPTNDLGSGQADGNYAFSGRLAGAVIQSEEGDPLLHAGLSVSVRDVDMIGYDSELADTGTLPADGLNLLGLEVASVMGPVHASAEYVMIDADLTGGADDPTFGAYYVQVGWFLTGEHRGYKASAAAFDRTVPNQSWTRKSKGFGAVEVAARYANLDLNDSGVNGGELDDITLGLNWYLNSNMRIMLDYAMTDIDTAGADGTLDALLLRFQADW